MIVELETRKRERGDEEEKDVADMSVHEKSRVRHGLVGSEDLVLVSLYAGLGLIPAIWGIIH
jgi:hypothetical protein